MYFFLRQELKIPFCEGKHSPDAYLETIFAAIQKRRIVDVLLDIHVPV